MADAVWLSEFPCVRVEVRPANKINPRTNRFNQYVTLYPTEGERVELTSETFDFNPLKSPETGDRIFYQLQMQLEPHYFPVHTADGKTRQQLTVFVVDVKVVDKFVQEMKRASPPKQGQSQPPQAQG